MEFSIGIKTHVKHIIKKDNHTLRFLSSCRKLESIETKLITYKIVSRPLQVYALKNLKNSEKIFLFSEFCGLHPVSNLYAKAELQPPVARRREKGPKPFHILLNELVVIHKINTLSQVSWITHNSHNRALTEYFLLPGFCFCFHEE